MNSTATLPTATLLNEQPLWMKPIPAIQALNQRKIVVQHGKNKRRGFLAVRPADPAGPNSGECYVAFCWGWMEGGLAWTDAALPIPTSQSRGSREYLSPDALELIEGDLDGPKIIPLKLVIPSG